MTWPCRSSEAKSSTRCGSYWKTTILSAAPKVVLDRNTWRLYLSLISIDAPSASRGPPARLARDRIVQLDQCPEMMGAGVRAGGGSVPGRSVTSRARVDGQVAAELPLVAQITLLSPFSGLSLEEEIRIGVNNGLG
jgi:hypothetical protein